MRVVARANRRDIRVVIAADLNRYDVTTCRELVRHVERESGEAAVVRIGCAAVRIVIDLHAVDVQTGDEIARPRNSNTTHFRSKPDRR